MVHIERQRPSSHRRQEGIIDDDGAGPSTTQIERDEEYARRLQVMWYISLGHIVRIW